MDGAVNKGEPILRYTQYSSEAALEFSPQQPHLRIICWQEILTLTGETAVSSLSRAAARAPTSNTPKQFISAHTSQMS